ncbi:MAG TPA: tryptophan synthase subunit alpha [Candidatus Thioglobus sp.]|jgi:tryptophan synthase alpha chain|nr:tryptophan synthase subunit alpha [Candidatus Thioglobus sp.]HIL43222.1 tryptophan synthase subunit alpha [Gammaproteobacteria bacterium]
MSRLNKVFSSLKQDNRKAFIPFITAGDSGIENTFELMQSLVNNGANIIELGVPFSDPMADGPVIAKSHERAVADGISLRDVLGLVRRFRKSNTYTPIVLMGYLNPIEVFGYEDFANQASQAGVDGVLVVDMPPEEAHDLKHLLNIVGIDFIFLVAPTTTDYRLKLLSKIASGFVYFVSLKGVTGAGNLEINSVNEHLERIRKYIDLPLGVGFGIKDTDTAKAVSKTADAVIVGSSIVSFIEKHAKHKDKMINAVSKFAKEISSSIN